MTDDLEALEAIADAQIGDRLHDNRRGISHRARKALTNKLVKGRRVQRTFSYKKRKVPITLAKSVEPK